MSLDTTKDEHGRSLYPKMVYPNGNGQAGVVVQNPKEEMEVLGIKAAPKKEEDKKEEDKKPAWGDKK